MRKKQWLMGLALLGLILSHLHLGCRVTVAGEPLDGLYTLQTLESCGEAAGEAASELLNAPAELPAPERRLRLSFRRPDGDPELLTEALLLSVEGVTRADAVIVNGERIGTVEDGRVLFQRLREYIQGQMPNAAAVGNISGKLQTRRVFAREGAQTNYDDMVLLVTGMAPVIYIDRDGRLA